jgi:beta-1,4-mannosyltransferase
MRGRPVRVLSYPPRHPYVDRLQATTAAELVHRDETWPQLPRFHDPAWVRDHASDWDVAHLHFTWEQYPVERFAAVLQAHRDAGRPVVWTAHDLRNPHTDDPRDDAPYLALLAAHAEAILTLTPGAAKEVRRRFGRHARVAPHGPLVPLDEIDAWRRRGRAVRTGRGDGPRRVLVLAKTLRANLDLRTPCEVVAELASEGIPIELDVHLHDDADVEVLRREVPHHDLDGVRWRRGGRLTDTELFARVAEADALLLPYRWGTHSGFLEVATDLGTPVVVSDVGYLDEQAACRVVRRGDDGRPDRGHLTDALRELVTDGPDAAVPSSDRSHALEAFRTIHRAVYAEVTWQRPSLRRVSGDEPRGDLGAGRREGRRRRGLRPPEGAERSAAEEPAHPRRLHRRHERTR